MFAPFRWVGTAVPHRKGSLRLGEGAVYLQAGHAEPNDI